MDFLDEIATLAPVPTGGAAAAYTSALGIVLIYKVLLLELNRKELDPGPQATLRVARKEIERLYLDLKKQVKEDPLCYVKFSQESKGGNRAESKSAFLDIVTCSMHVMEKSYEGLEWVRQLGKMSSVKLLPHLRVAAELLSAGAAATAHVVRENLKPIKSPLKQQSYVDNLESLYQDAMAKKNEVLQTF
jgi:formiminotetrahydrofolate cyclodeaminase